MTIIHTTRQNSFKNELALLLRLSIPIQLGLLVFRLLGVTTMYFIGNLGAQEMAAAGIAVSMASITGYSVIIGLSGAVQTIAGQAYGAQNYALVGYVLQRGIIIAFIACIPITVLWMAAEPLLIVIGQDVELSKIAAQFLHLLIPGLWFNACMVCVLDWLRAQGRVIPPTVVVLLVSFVHVALNILLVQKAGLGVRGAAIAMSITHFLETVLLIGYIMVSGIHKQTWSGWSKMAFKGWAQFLKLAVPSFFMITEWWAAELIVMFAGRLDDPRTSVSAISIYQTTNGLCFMAGLGLSVAVTTRVSNELGSGNAKGAKTSAKVAVLVAISTTLSVAFLLLLFGKNWISIFTRDQKVINLTHQLFIVLAPRTLLDSMQVILSGIIRGSGRQESGAAIVTFSYWGVAIPLALIFAFQMQLKALGLVLGMAIGNVIHALAFMFIVLRTNWEREVQKALQQYGGGSNNDVHIVKGEKGHAMQVTQADPQILMVQKIDTSHMLELQIQNIQPVYDSFPSPGKVQTQSQQRQINDSAQTSRNPSFNAQKEKQSISETVFDEEEQAAGASQISVYDQNIPIENIQNDQILTGKQFSIFDPARSVVRILGCLGFVLLLLFRSLQYDLQSVRTRIMQFRRYY